MYLSSSLTNTQTRKEGSQVPVHFPMLLSHKIVDLTGVRGNDAKSQLCEHRSVRWLDASSLVLFLLLIFIF